MPITVDQLKQYLPGFDGTGEDTNLTAFLEPAESLLAAYCGWAPDDVGETKFSASTYTVQLWGPSAVDPRKQYLPVGWFESVASVVIDSNWDFDAPSTTLVEGDDFVVDQRSRCLRLKPGGSLSEWPKDGSLRVTFTGGWTAYPSKVVAVVAYQARYMWRSRTDNTVDSHTHDGSTVSRRDPSAVPPAIRAMAAAAGLLLWGRRAA